MNVQCSLILKFMLYEFKVGHNATEVTQNFCRAKGEGEVDHDATTNLVIIYKAQFSLTQGLSYGTSIELMNNGMLAKLANYYTTLDPNLYNARLEGKMRVTRSKCFSQYLIPVLTVKE